MDAVIEQKTWTVSGAITFGQPSEKQEGQMIVRVSLVMICSSFALVSCGGDARPQADSPLDSGEVILANYNTIDMDGYIVSLQIGEKFLHVKTMHSYQEKDFQPDRMEDFEFKSIDENGQEFGIPKKTGAIPEYTSVMVLVGEVLYERSGTPMPRRLVVIHNGRRFVTERKDR